jgi:hypothetical protein
MTNFLQRLIARNTAKANLPGTAVLHARPISRFEPTGAISEVASESVAPRDRKLEENSGPVLRSGNPARPATESPQHESERRSNESQSQTAMPRLTDKIQNPAVAEQGERQNESFTRQQTIAMEPTRTETEPRAYPIDSVPSVPTEKANLVRTDYADPHPQVQSISFLPPIDIFKFVEPGAHDQSLHKADVLKLALLTQEAAKERVSDKKQDTSSVSIGKIEVQFLQPNLPTPIARPTPAGNRGFDNYARARRGQPR